MASSEDSTIAARRCGFVSSAMLAIGEVDQHVDRAGQIAVGIEQRSGKGEKRNARPVRTFGDGFHASYGALFPESHRHRAFVVRQRLSIRPVEFPRPAEFALAQFGSNAPEVDGGLVVKGDATVGVGCIDSFGQSFENVLNGKVVAGHPNDPRVTGDVRGRAPGDSADLADQQGIHSSLLYKATVAALRLQFCTVPDARRSMTCLSQP